MRHPCWRMAHTVWRQAPYIDSSAVNPPGSFEGCAFRGGQVKAETASSVTLPQKNTGEMERMKIQFEVGLLRGSLRQAKGEG